MPTEQELKNEMFKLKEILQKKESEVTALKAQIADIESQLGMAQPGLAAPIPSVGAAPAAPAAPATPAAPAIPAAPVPQIQTAPSASTASSAGKSKSILQKIPRSGTSQLHARETQFECPNCGSHYNSEIEDKTRILYVVGAGTRIYAKKHRCMNCGNEWS